MTRNELQTALKELGCKDLCNDGKTLSAYNQIQTFLKYNRTPIKAITDVYLEGTEIRIVLWGSDDFESGYDLMEEL